MRNVKKEMNNKMKIEEFKSKLKEKAFKDSKDFYEVFSTFHFSNNEDYNKFYKEIVTIIKDTNQYDNLLADVSQQIKPDRDLEFIGVAKIDASKKQLPTLQDGEIDISNFSTNCHMLTFDPIITKHICKLGNAKYWNYGAPITLVADSIKKYKALEARSRLFDSIPEIIEYLKNNKNTLVYTINYFTFKKKYSLRSFGDDGWCIGNIQYYYTKFRFWLNKRIKKGKNEK